MIFRESIIVKFEFWKVWIYYDNIIVLLFRFLEKLFYVDVLI